MVKNKTRRIGRCHSAPYSTNSSSQSSDEELDHTKGTGEIPEPCAPENTISDNAFSHFENWVTCNNKIGGAVNDGSVSCQLNDQIKQSIGKETCEITVEETNCLLSRKVSEVENCDESSLSGR